MYLNDVTEKKKLHTMLNAESVAVVGASKKIGSIGYTLFDKLIKSDYNGRVLPINPKYDMVQGYAAVVEPSGIKCFVIMTHFVC